MTILMELTKTIRLRLNFNERLSILWPPKSIQIKAWFSYVGKIPDNRGFYFLPTIPDFADISDIREEVWRRFSRLFVIEGLEFTNLGDW